MMLFTLTEIVDMIAMTAIIGFIFKDTFSAPKEDYEPLHYYKQRFRWDDIRFAIYVVAPAILLHELGHKFTALSFGLHATFQAAYFFLGLGIVLKLLNFPFIFFVIFYSINKPHEKAASHRSLC